MGVAADAVVVDASETNNEGGILASVAALPQSVIENSSTIDLGIMMIVIGNQVSSAAVNLLKFVTPPSSATAAATGGTQDTSGGVTYSEVLRSLYTHGIIYHLGDDWHRSNIRRSWGSHYWGVRICALQV